MNKKKVGILTFHKAINYGAVLQAYALKETILNYGFDCDIIDYYCPAIEDGSYKLFTKDDKFKTKVKKIITWPVQKKRNEKFKQFIEEVILNSNQTRYSRENIKECEDKFDYFLVGSDQVWSPLCTNGDKTYFLDFVEDSAKKNTYAASMGLADSTFFTEEICLLISSFNSLSVRERSRVDFLKKVLNERYNKPIFCCLDPVFLLKKSQWYELLQPIKENDGDYIFVYSLSMPKEIIQFAKTFAKAKNLRILYCTFNNLISYSNKRNTVIASPKEFLSYMANAKYVITNSFHGTAFSIIFNKNFISITNSNPKHDNSRLVDLLESVGLKDRLISYNCISWPNSGIDYTSVELRLQNYVDYSKKYLSYILQ